MDDKNTMNSSGDNSITIDYIGSTDAALDTLTLDIGDTITLGSSCYTFSSGSPCTVTFPSYGVTGTSYSGNTFSYATIGNYDSSKVNIDADCVQIKEGGDLKIGNVSIRDFIQRMEERLAILVPDPAKLEKFEALKRAYDHYKTMESLCFDEPESEDKK